MSIFKQIISRFVGNASADILVTGGTGFIGSHTVVDLLQNGYSVVIVDNLCNSSKKVLERIERIVGQEAFSRLAFYEADIRDAAALSQIFSQHHIKSVIHFAGLKAVGESVEKPLAYYENNIGGTCVLCRVMEQYGCKSLIFSSSSTVYGDPDELPLTEESPKKNATNPYGWTKWMIEQILIDLQKADKAWDIVLLRYFNPIGAHESGLIGEDPKGIPNNLVPYIAQTAVGKRDVVHVFGNDYDTPDGTGIRDYIHVVDLAAGHVAALKWMQGKHGVEIFNLGTGSGASVIEVIEAFKEVAGKDIAYVIEERRAGDIAQNYADATKAEKILGWRAEKTLQDMVADSWRWQSKNPEGLADD